MKRSVLIFACLFICNIPANAVDTGLMQSGPAILNKTNEAQLKELQIEQKYVQTVPKDLDAEKNALEKQKKKDVVKGNLTYNPQFKLNKIVFKGNTVYNDKKLLKLAESGKIPSAEFVLYKKNKEILT